ncbi:MAG: hypothetical protein CMG62_11550 [Candidatus Marinimicrobia bacterium]|nr:hypothetical protein [Candidatus Neomarinimicrobiota bacterium]
MIFFMQNFKKIILFFFISYFVYGDDSWKVYDDSEIAIINIYIDQDKIDWMYDNVYSDSLHVASISFQNAHINESTDSIGFRLRGNTSRNAEKKSFKIDFNHFISGRDFFGVEKLNLNGEHNDPSIVRSKLCWDLFQDIGMVSSRAAHAELYINGDYYGLYVSVEHIDDSFIEKNYVDGSGNLWKCIWPADLTYRGNDAEDYEPYWGDERPYELKTNKEIYDYSKLARLIRVINQEPDSLEFVLNVKEALQYLAMNILTGSWDDYRSNINNFYLYHEPEKDIFHWIPFDYDNTFGVDWFGIDWSTIDPYEYELINDGPRPLTEYLFSEIRYRNLFTHFLDFYNTKLFSDTIVTYQPVSAIEYRLETLKESNYISAFNDVYRTYDYGFNIQDYQNSFGFSFENQHVKQGIMEFISSRSVSLNSQLYYSGSEPIIYQGEIGKNIALLDDPFIVSVSAFGPQGIDEIKFHFKFEEETDWETINLNSSSVPLTYKVEENDHWEAEVIPTDIGNYIGYFTANYNGDIDRYPVSGYKTFEVVEPAGQINVKINEILAKNDQTITDEYGEYDDWLELAPADGFEADLSGHYLTDKLDNLTKWQFPQSTQILNSGEFMLVWCDEDESQGSLHTNFKLSAGGEFLALVAPDGNTIIDSITFPEQSSDISFGRSGTQGSWDYMTPTPYEQNQILNLDPTKNEISSFKLNSIYPNPFNSVINLDITVQSANHSFEIYLVSLLGKIISKKKTFYLKTGLNTINWDIRDQKISSGVYFVKIDSDNQKIKRKIIYLK